MKTRTAQGTLFLRFLHGTLKKKVNSGNTRGYAIKRRERMFSRITVLLQTLGIIYSSRTQAHSSCHTERFERTRGNGMVLNFPSDNILHPFT